MNALTIKYILEVVVALVGLIAGNLLLGLIGKNSKKVWERVALLVIRVAGSIIILLWLAICCFTDFMLYHPCFDEAAHEKLLQEEAYEELAIETPIGTCGGWFFHAEENPYQVTVVLYQGNTQSSAQTLAENVKLHSQLMGNLVLTDFPGYGKSEGIPTEQSLKKMALSAFDQLMAREDMQNQHIVILGYSLGTGIANYVASQREVDGLILIAPYQNGYDLFNRFVDIFHGPVKALLPFKMRSDQFAETVEVTPLIMAATDDEMISYESSKQLSLHFPKGSKFLTYEGLGHVGFWQDENVWKEIYSYMEDCAGKE